jgi:hypothetical protein
MLLFFFLSAVMSGLETDRYEYSNLQCGSRQDGKEGSHNPYKLWLCLHFLCSPLAVSLSQPTCVLPQMTAKNVSDYAKTRLGQQNLWAHMLFFAKCATIAESHLLLALLLRPRLKWIDGEGSAAGTRVLQSACYCAVLYMSYVDLVYQPWRI